MYLCRARNSVDCTVSIVEGVRTLHSHLVGDRGLTICFSSWQPAERRTVAPQTNSARERGTHWSATSHVASLACDCILCSMIYTHNWPHCVRMHCMMYAYGISRELSPVRLFRAPHENLATHQPPTPCPNIGRRSSALIHGSWCERSKDQINNIPRCHPIHRTR